MSKFRPLSFYEESLKTGYKLLPFQFTRLEGDEYLVSNLVGEFVILDRPTLEDFARHTLAPKTSVYDTLKSKHFLLDDDSRLGAGIFAVVDLADLETFSACSTCDRRTPLPRKTLP